MKQLVVHLARVVDKAVVLPDGFKLLHCTEKTPKNPMHFLCSV